MGYQTIFSVINEHTASTVTARYAISLALACKARLVLYAAHAEGTDDSLLRHTDRHLDHLFTAAFDLGIAVTRITEAGAVSQFLAKRAEAERADLVFYPLTPGERYGAPLQQQTARYLLQRVKADLAIMRIMHMGRPHPHRILMPVGSTIKDREQRLEFVAALAKSFHSQVTLFHRPAGGKQGVPDDFILLRDELRRHHLPVLERSGVGHIARAISLEAVSHHNDLIVLGASERGLLQRMFFGNPAGDVMHHPPCNAILFRPERQIP